MKRTEDDDSAPKSQKRPKVDETTVTNVKIKFIRPKYHTLKEWTEDVNNIYIGRAGVVFVDKVRFPKKASIWANPFKVGKVDGNINQVIEKYRIYIKEKVEKEGLEVELMALKGCNLGCWCVSETLCFSVSQPVICHGQVLLEMINERSSFVV
jgi:hypothetical protein